MKEGFGQTGSENSPDQSLYLQLSKAKHYPDNSGLMCVQALVRNGEGRPEDFVKFPNTSSSFKSLV